MINKKKVSNKSKFKGNPRQITKKQYGLLKEHLEELGDLAGVVYCHNQKAFVGGNQRSEVFNGAKIEITEKYDKPTKSCTVALGFIEYKGEKYAYREVAYTKEQFDKACIVANSDGGSFDWDILANEWKQTDLEDWGVNTGGFDFKSEEFNEDFTLPSGDKSPFQQITFTLSDEQAEEVKTSIKNAKKDKKFKKIETFNNENNNGNALFFIMKQWAEQRK